jgi:putative membrane protein
MMNGWIGGSWVWGFVMMVVMVGAVALVVWAIVRTGGDRPGVHRPDALEILEERFARAEIDEEEFERRRQVLQKR